MIFLGNLGANKKLIKLKIHTAKVSLKQLIAIIRSITEGKNKNYSDR